MFFYILILTILLFVIYVYLKNNAQSNHYIKYKIPFYKGALGLGYTWEYCKGDQPLFKTIDDIYQKFPSAPVIATRSLLNSAFIIKDIENVQHVMSGDFNAFNHRGVEINEDVDVLGDNVLFMNGLRWKLTRQKLTPLFTSAKLRNMYYILDTSAQDFVTYLKTSSKQVDTFDMLRNFCFAALSASVFGIGADSNMDSHIVNMCKKATAPTFKSEIKFILASGFVSLFKLLKISLFSEHEDFFIGAMKQVFKARREDDIKRHDFADLCLEVQRNGTMKDPVTGYEIEPTDELMSAQAFFFFLAGVDTSAVTMMFILLELARHPAMLARAHKEIDDMFVTNKGEVNYDSVLALKYLEMVMDEALRMHPPIGTITRKSTARATLPVGNIPVEINTIIQIPAYSIHHDPKYYPDPEKFDPERFTAEGKQSRPNYSYLAFGEGNRMCLGLRFARMQVKAGLVHILRHFTVKLKDGPTEISYKKHPIQLRPKDIDFTFSLR